MGGLGRSLQVSLVRSGVKVPIIFYKNKEKAEFCTMRTPRSEDDILALLAEHFPVLHPDLLVGRGDDCAVLRPGGPLAVTCDVFVEDVHFRRRYFSAADIGHKALAVNLSDVASAGARPTGFMLGLTLTGREDETWLHGLAEGIGRAWPGVGGEGWQGAIWRGRSDCICASRPGESFRPIWFTACAEPGRGKVTWCSCWEVRGWLGWG